MRNFVTHASDGTYTVQAAMYTLHIVGHTVVVSIENNRFATLDVRCAVPMTNNGDTGSIPDNEPNLPTLTNVEEANGKAVFTWENESSLWHKTYRLTCDYLRFRFELTLHGQGRVDEIWYFSGDRGSRWGSGYEFQEGFTPCVSWYNEEDYHFKASTNCHRWSVLMVPPMFCYAFKCENSTRRLGLGLVAEKGEHNFHSFDYRSSPIGSFHSGFALVTDQMGHATVNGDWTAPAIVGFSGDDQWDILNQYTDYYFQTGIAQPRNRENQPRFWYGPMICGWIEQIERSIESGRTISEPDMCRQEMYETMVEEMHKYDLHPTALIIDDKWQNHYATDVVNTDKWQDLRGFVDARHKEGIHTMLWFKLWDPDGWDEKLCVHTDNGELRLDPSTPEFLANLDEVLHRLLSADEGCYDCDGMKLDFAFINPIGRKVHTHSGKYGVELLYEMQAYIYEKSKEIKPYALINASPCHPYFAHICDQARLHDYNYNNRNNREDLVTRGKMFSAAMPGVLLDTDNAGYANYRDTMHWLLTQPLTGVPDLYSLIGTATCPMDDSDFFALSQLWQEYTDKIDRLYGENK